MRLSPNYRRITAIRHPTFSLLVFSGLAEGFPIVHCFGGYAQLLFEFLFRIPGINLLHDDVRLCVGLWVVDRHGYFQVVVIEAVVTFLDLCILAAWMA